MSKLLTLLVLLAACGPMTPEERGIEVSDLIGVFNQDKAMFTAQYMVEDHYGANLDNLALDSTVYWTDTVCPKNGQYAVIYRGQCNFGRMWSCDEMYVALSNADPERTTGSALLHEFGHCLQMKLGLPITESGEKIPGSCGPHDPEFWGIIKEAEQVARNRGW